MKWRALRHLVPVLILVLVQVQAAFAHGAEIVYSVDMAVQIKASYDTGEPMAGGQVTVYAPDDPSTPWLTGACDQEGYFIFTPDPQKPGTWDVQVRKAGHGDMVHIEIGEGAAASGGGGLSTGQILLMAACVAWGCIGTALFFSRGRGARAAVISTIETGEETKA